jgi:hypothetical protein
MQEVQENGRLGHECHSKPKKEQAHVAQEEDEASLLLMRASSTLTNTLPPPPSPSLLVASTPVQLREQKVFAHL